MRIPRSLIGKEVKFLWMDPTGMKVKSHVPGDRSSLPRGRGALATWTEYGLLDDVTDGVVRLLQSVGVDGVLDPEKTDDYTIVYVPEVLIEHIYLGTFEEITP